VKGLTLILARSIRLSREGVGLERCSAERQKRARLLSIRAVTIFRREFIVT
jgi:hypothetical protein